MTCGCRHSGFVGVAPAYGLSAYAILHGGADYPHDPADFCRCLSVSPMPPLHMRERSPEWAVLVDHWVELAGLLVEEHPSGSAPKTYARMKALFKSVREVS